MPSYQNWDPFRTHVQGGLREGNYLNGQFVLICAGPPFFSQLAFPGDDEGNAASNAPNLVYPIGLAQNIALSQNRAVSRIFEIGSDRAYFISGRSVGQLSLGRVVYHGPSLLRTLYAYYDTVGDPTEKSMQIRPLIKGSKGVNPYSTVGSPDNSGQAAVSQNLKSIRIPPGHDNMFLNLASDLFSQPMGLLLVLKDNAENNVASVYLDQCHVPQHMLAVDSQGLIMQESVAIQYERMVPIRQAQINLVDGVLADNTAGQVSSYTV